MNSSAVKKSNFSKFILINLLSNLKLQLLLLLLPIKLITCLPASSTFVTSNVNHHKNHVNYGLKKYKSTLIGQDKPNVSSYWLLSPSPSASAPWTSFVALGSEEVKNIAINEPPSSSVSISPSTEDLSSSSSRNETVNLYSSIGRPLTSSFRTNIYRCDKTLAIIDYIDENRIFRCELFDLEKRLDEAKDAASQRRVPIVNVSFSFLQNLISRCQDLERFNIQNGPTAMNLQSDDQSEANRGNSTDSIYGFWRGIIPGTKWCGPGDIAKDYFDVGQIWEIDLCCRAHDHCPYRLKAFRTDYGLINLAFYTRSHCECDEEFHRCLKKSNTNLGSTLGNIYFNVMQVQCFKEEEETSCVRSRFNSNGQKECISYAPNGNRKMIFSQPKPYN
ncbi:uncharacterized protein LOC107366574 [Tetranychus urticae]|uniref:Phospholipase A2 n=1 Tax=Tetranychus urticae TaxID=32264 RepID=T1KQV3_TETUR|nr:uncharacterized protein LOC107366574 [Tetranychus urticae]